MKFKYLLNESDSLRNTFLKSLVDKLEKTYGKSDTRFFGKADCDRLIKRDTDEEITILQLRKNLEINTYEEIAKKLPIKLSVNSLKQKVYLLRAKLGADNIDTAIRIFEERYYKL